MIKLLRSPIKFQERASGVWSDRVLDIVGGGTGAATASGARTALGLGTMATQDSSAVNISGGTITGNGAGLTNLTAANITSGGTLPNLNGSNLTTLSASALASGTVAVARLGSGAGGGKFLRDDNTWQVMAAIRQVAQINVSINRSGDGASYDYTWGGSFTDYSKVHISQIRSNQDSGVIGVLPVSATVLRIYNNVGGGSYSLNCSLFMTEFM